jgi:hypothetical protein
MGQGKPAPSRPPGVKKSTGVIWGKKYEKEKSKGGKCKRKRKKKKRKWGVKR